MERSRALVIGALGQDGSFICDILLKNNYEVFGLIKPSSDNKRFNPKVNYIQDKISNIDSVIRTINPNHIYNFMGVTDIFDPWDNPVKVYEDNFLTPVKIIESIKKFNIKIKYLQASSSLVFGSTDKSPQNELSERNPVYNYGMAKKFTDDFIKLYREKFNMHLNSVILYPHESERRGDNFFSKKIIKGAIDIKLGNKKIIEVGDLHSLRDIGYAEDYMNACFKIMNLDYSDDYVIGTGKLTKNIDFIKIVFSKLNIDFEKHIIVNEYLKRDYDLSNLVADCSKLNKIGWNFSKSVDDIIDIMITHELNK